LVLSPWQFRLIFHPAFETGFVCQQSARVSKVSKLLPLTLHSAPIGFSFVAIHLGNVLQSSAEVTSHACTPLLSLYIPESSFAIKEGGSCYFEVFSKICSFSPAAPPFCFTLQ